MNEIEKSSEEKFNLEKFLSYYYNQNKANFSSIFYYSFREDLAVNFKKEKYK